MARLPPDDRTLHNTICAEIDGGTEGDTLTRVKLAECGKSPAAELLAGLATAVGSVADDAGCVFIFAEQDANGFSRWVIASQLPPAWPQSSSSKDTSPALTRSPLA